MAKITGYIWDLRVGAGDSECEAPAVPSDLLVGDIALIERYPRELECQPPPDNYRTTPLR